MQLLTVAFWALIQGDGEAGIQYSRVSETSIGPLANKLKLHRQNKPDQGQWCHSLGNNMGTHEQTFISMAYWLRDHPALQPTV